MNASILFVTGTDTEVGKTHIGEAIARELSHRGIDVRTVKPVESGVDGNHPEDGIRLAKATGQDWPRQALQRFKAPLAPPLAAKLEGEAIQVQEWIKSIEALGQRAQLLLIEGAGGLLSPLDWDSTLLDLAKRWPATALVVDADRLGSVGRSRLCLNVLATSGIPVRGLVLNAPETADQTTGQNEKLLSKLEPGIRIATAPRSDRHGALTKPLEGILKDIENDCITSEAI